MMKNDSDNLKEKVAALPQSPGVYLMKDDCGNIIYVGKAARLRNRVSSYFSGTHTGKTEVMVNKILSFDVIVCESEFDALCLENKLIKEYKPKYNVRLRDDKGYPFVRINLADEYPAMKIVSNPMNDKAIYLGPFGGRGDTRKAIFAISKALKIPTCGKKLSAKSCGTDRTCLNYDMGNCPGYCQEAKLHTAYMESIHAAIDILSGNTSGLLKKLNAEMKAASGELNFESAAVFRDRIEAIKALDKKQFFTETSIGESLSTFNEKMRKSLTWLKDALSLDLVPLRIEAYDISNTGVAAIVGAMVVFSNGKPEKSEYKRFKIKTKSNQDDYGSMAEVIRRRLKRYNADDPKFNQLPDLLLVDGGQAHASVAVDEVCKADLNIPVFGMVKDKKHKTKALIDADGNEIAISANPAAFVLIGTIQEEVHRFAIEYHRKVRSKEMVGGAK